MTPAGLIVELVGDGVELWAEGDRLRYRADPGVVTPRRVGLLRDHKADLLRLLADPDALREEAARAIFDAEPDPAAAAAPGELRPDDEAAMDALDEALALDVDGREEGCPPLPTPPPSPASVWWDDTMPAGSVPVRLIPPRGCIAPRICARLGECDRFLAGS